MTKPLSYSTHIPSLSTHRRVRSLWGNARACAVLAVALYCCLVPAAAVFAQKKPKPALKEKDARAAIANAAGFALSKGAVRVRSISDAGVSPIVVVAEVTTAFRFRDESEGGAGALQSTFKGAEGAGAPAAMTTKWHLAEVRTGDRNWEEIDFLTAPFGAEKVERARVSLESLAAEFETQQRERKSDKEIVHDNLRIKSFSALMSSAVAEIGVEASFRLERDARGKWRVIEVRFGNDTSGDLDTLLASVNAQKLERARVELAEIKTALEAFHVERGFYVVAKDESALMDFLSPRYARRIIRIDPWHRPYRYEGTRDNYSLRSDGADGAAGTADDVASGK